MTLAVVDACGANISSVLGALRRLGVEPVVTKDPAQIMAASRVLLPGVGSAGNAMSRLRETGLDTVIPSLKQPVLGICVGMQVLFEGSEEDDCSCLGIIDSTLKRIPHSAVQPVPHMGWNRLKLISHPQVSDPVHSLLDDLGPEPYCYFVHSYAAPRISETIASCEYGFEFSAAVAKANFFGVQFHPERSASLGAKVLRNFLQLDNVA